MIDTKSELDLLAMLQKKMLSLELEFTDHVHRMRLIIEEIEKLQLAKDQLSRGCDVLSEQNK